MAASSTALDSLQQHLTCPICLAQYCNPKTLPCLHSFCLKCIQQLPVDSEEGKHVISCPTCRKTVVFPHNKPENLPTAFIINGFIEFQEQLEKVYESKQICENCEENGAVRYCKQCACGFCEKCFKIHNGLKVNARHQSIDMNDVTATTTDQLPDKQEFVMMDCTDHSKPAEIFCETCQELICRDCTIRRHKDHNFDLIADVLPKHQQDIRTALGVVLKKMLGMQDVLEALTRREDDVTKQRDDRVREIHHLIQSIVDSIQESGNQLIAEVDKIAESKLQLLSQQKQEAEAAMVQLESYKDFVEKSLEVSNPQQMLSAKQDLIEGMEVASKQIDLAMFQPLEEADIAFIENTTAVAIKSKKCLGKLTYSHSIKGNMAASVFPMTGRKVTTTLSLQTRVGLPCKIPPSLPLTCHLISPDASQVVACDIKEIEAGKYFVSFTPLARGMHQVQFQVGGIDIDGSPFSLYVMPSPEMRGKPVRIMPGLDVPYGVAVDKNGQLIVAECNSHCISVYDKEGKIAFVSVGPGRKKSQFNSPRGVAVTNDGHILVTDDHRLQKLAPADGRCIMSVGSKGKGPLNFSHPVGIAVHPSTGQIYIADDGNHRIQVINDDFTYSHSFGSKGRAPGQLNSPQDVALDAVGNVYVVSWNNHCIDAFTSDGKHLRQFGSRGSGDGQLIHPVSIAIDTKGLVYVTERFNSRVSIFTTSGQFIRHLGHDFEECGEEEFSCLCSITIDAFGNLYVSDSGSHRVIML